MPVSKYSADEVTLNMLKRFNLSMHTIGGKEYAFYGKRSGDLFNYGLDLKGDFSFIKAYAVEAKVLESKFRDIMYEMRNSPSQSKINNAIIRDYVLQIYKKYEKEVDRVVKSALDTNLTEALSDKDIYYEAISDLNSSLGVSVKEASSVVTKTRKKYSVANPFENIPATSEELFALFLSSGGISKSNYIIKFVDSFVGMDIVPSLTKDILNRFIAAGKSDSFSLEENEINDIIGKYHSKIDAYLSNYPVLQHYIESIKANADISIVDNPVESDLDGDAIEVEPTSRGYANLYKIIKKFAQPSGNQIQPSGNQIQPSGNQIQPSGSDKSSDASGNQGDLGGEDSGKPLVFGKKTLSQQLRLSLAEYLSDTYVKKGGKNSDDNMNLFDSFIGEISDMVGVNAQTNASQKIINNVKQVIDIEVQSAGGISKWISKEDLEDNFKLNVNNSKFLKFLKDSLIPAEQEDPSDKTNIFQGLTGKVVNVDMLGNNVVFISQMSNTDGVPTYILNSRSTLKKSIDIYRTKYL